MFYLSNRKIKLFIISILLLIFCFILGIFDVKAVYTYELYELDKVNLTYLTYAGDTPINAITDFTDLDYDKITFYDTFYSHIKENLGTTEPYTGIRGYLNFNDNGITYYSFIVYSPTQINSNTWTVCMSSGGCSTNINENSVNSPQVTEIKLNTSSDNYFYIIGWYGLANNGSGRFTHYTFQWYNSDYFDSLVTSTPNVYAISNLYSFSSLAERDEFMQSTYDYLSSVTDEDPELPDNPILSPYIDTSSWPSDIGGWGHSFDSNANISTLITMPITLLQAIINHVNDTCVPFSLGSLYNTNLYFPCISINRYLGNDLVHIIDLMIAGVIIFKIGKKFVVIFNDFTNLRDTQISELYGGGK